MHSNAFAEQTKGLEPLQVRHERLQNRRLQTRSRSACVQIFDLQGEAVQGVCKVFARVQNYELQASLRKPFCWAGVRLTKVLALLLSQGVL